MILATGMNVNKGASGGYSFLINEPMHFIYLAFVIFIMFL